MSKGNKKKTNLHFLSNLEDLNTPGLGDPENDPSLEAELLELMGGNVNPAQNLDRDAKKHMKPIVIDTNLLNLDLNDDNNDGDFDENDPELLAELDSYLNESKTEEHLPKNVLAPQLQTENIKKLENLKNLYQEAIHQATVTNDTSKARRLDRLLKTINELLQRAMRGQPLDESEFPPLIHVIPMVVPPPPPSTGKLTQNKPPMEKVTNEPPSKFMRPSNTNNKVLDALCQRQSEYKHAAIDQRSKNVELAKGLLVVCKQFDEVIRAVEAGESFDLEDMPPPASEFQLSDLNMTAEEGGGREEQMEPEKKDTLRPIGEELKIRMAFYNESITKATAEGNAGKVRRLNRVVQQYQEAIAAFQKHIPFVYEELPPPPGRPPLSSNQAIAATAAKSSPMGPPTAKKPPQIVATATTNKTSKMTKMLMDRQIEFKAAALKAKQEGDLSLAKELLRNAMAFDKMVQASESGLPVDLSKLPSLPTEADNFHSDLVIVDQGELPAALRHNVVGTNRESALKQMKITLLEQIETCRRYANSVSLAGDVMGAKRFEEMAKSCEKDLLGLRGICEGPKNSEIALPRFHYEYRSFAIVQSNPDLAETEMSVEVIRATNLALPQGYSADQFDTYIVLELAFPSEEFQTFTTETVKRTNNPTYNSVNKFKVNLKSRVFQRVVKNKPLKAEIFYRKGFLQKDKLYGTSSIKLELLETNCTIHDSVDITENRKVVAGKLEVKVRLRSPLLSNQSQTVKEKWLVIDDFNQIHSSTPFIGSVDTSGVAGVGSLEVIKFEIGELKRKFASGGTSVNASLATAIRQKIGEKEAVARKQEEKLKSADPSVRLAYLNSISKLPQEYNNEAKRFLGENNRDKAQLAMTKKKLVEREIEQLNSLRRKS